MRQTPNVLYIPVDSLIPAHGKSVPGLDEFTAALDHAGIPAVWLTSRSRLQFDEPRRRLGHQHPFIAEDGCCVYMPEGYFHLRPESSSSITNRTSTAVRPGSPGSSTKRTPAGAVPQEPPRSSSKRAPTTMRLGRFTCIPAAEPLPAAANALETLSEDTGIDVVTLRSLSPRELVQNSGLPLREAELARQRDFDELFFFAGASDADMQRFSAEAHHRKLQLRQHGVLWSLGVGASLQLCIRNLSKLYDRALRHHAHVVGIATPQHAHELFPYCERTILLTDRKSGDTDYPQPPHALQFPLQNIDTWELLLESISAKKSSGRKDG